MGETHGSIQVFPDAESLAVAAAGWIADTIQAVLAERPVCVLALVGGHTPIGTYANLVKRHGQSVPWERVLFLQGDERMVPPDHEASNYAMARRELLGPLGIPDGSVVRVPTEGYSAEEAAAEYEERLKATLGRSGSPSLDLSLLGLGEDGHTASLMPGSAALRERDRLVSWCSSSELEYPRVTLTLPALNRTMHVAFLVSGQRKAEALARVLEGNPGPETLPAQRIRPASGYLHWFVDAQAARRLSSARSEISRRFDEDKDS